MLIRNNRRRFIRNAAGLLVPAMAGIVCAQIIKKPRFTGGLLYSTLGSNSGSTSNVASYATSSSFTPTANALVLCGVVNSKASTPDTPTVSGNGLTWVQIATVTFGTIASATIRATLFRALGAGPTNGATTADFAGVNQTGAHVFVGQFRFADTTGTNGSGAIVQSTTNRADSGANPVITLSALASARNGVFGWLGNAVNGFGGTNETNWSEDYDGGYNTPATGGYATHISPTSDNTVNVTMTAANWGGIAVEVKAA
jgi:hypothetical protein